MSAQHIAEFIHNEVNYCSSEKLDELAWHMHAFWSDVYCIFFVCKSILPFYVTFSFIDELFLKKCIAYIDIFSFSL